jgi:hypothetical protein
VARPEFAQPEVTNVSELLYQNIVPQHPHQSSQKPSKHQNTKQLYLFGMNAKIFKTLRFRTEAECHTGAVTLWPMSYWPMTTLEAETEEKEIF